MHFLALFGLLIIGGPYTQSGNFYQCGRVCPKLNCGSGWRVEFIDMSGAKKITCREYTKHGQDLKTLNARLKSCL